MQWELVVALVIAIPIILFPAAYVWYLNIGGIYAAIKEARAKRVAQENNTKAAREVINEKQDGMFIVNEKLDEELTALIIKYW